MTLRDAIQAVLNVINGVIKTALNAINSVRTAVSNFYQQVTWPVSLINEAKAMVTQMIGQYRSLMASILNINLKSATLLNPAALETAMRDQQTNNFTKSFDWRVRRLVDRGLVERRVPLAGKGEVVYSIASSGAEPLQDLGENCLLGHDRSGRKRAERSVFHALGVNDIHLSALRAGVLVRWTGALAIRSQNELTEFGFAKDYDAIVTVRTEAGERRFALDYERSAKTMDRYKTIAASLSMEARVNQVLYLVTSDDLLRFISSHIGKAQCRVYFGLARDWYRQLLDMPVTSCLSTTPRRFREALDGAVARPNPAAISP